MGILEVAAGHAELPLIEVIKPHEVELVLADNIIVAVHDGAGIEITARGRVVEKQPVLRGADGEIILERVGFLVVGAAPAFQGVMEAARHPDRAEGDAFPLLVRQQGIDVVILAGQQLLLDISVGVRDKIMAGRQTAVTGQQRLQRLDRHKEADIVSGGRDVDAGDCSIMPDGGAAAHAGIERAGKMDVADEAVAGDAVERAADDGEAEVMRIAEGEQCGAFRQLRGAELQRGFPRLVHFDNRDIVGHVGNLHFEGASLALVVEELDTVAARALDCSGDDVIVSGDQPVIRELETGADAGLFAGGQVDDLHLVNGIAIRLVEPFRLVGRCGCGVCWRCHRNEQTDDHKKLTHGFLKLSSIIRASSPLPLGEDG